jgi:HCO3- transporter family
VQSLIAQGSQFPLRKPAGFHYDFALLGLTTFLAGLLGTPALNGLIPQAPIHTRALLVHRVINQDEDVLCDGDGNARLREVPIAVVEHVFRTSPRAHYVSYYLTRHSCMCFIWLPKVCQMILPPSLVLTLLTTHTI